MKARTLRELQEYFKQKAQERGFADETAQDTVLLMIEELGELAKAIRKHAGIKTERQARIPAIEDEMADLQIYLLHLANILGISLEDAFWNKEAKNDRRTWEA